MRTKGKETLKELDIIFDNWLANFSDKVLYDNNKPTESGEANRSAHWDLGQFSFHATYREIYGRKGEAVFTLKWKDINSKKDWRPVAGNEEQDNPISIMDKLLREARKTRHARACDLKAQKGSLLHIHSELPNNIIAKLLSGSYLYGLNHDGFQLANGEVAKPSDLDIRGIFLAPTKDILVSSVIPDSVNVKEMVEIAGRDEKYDELAKFIHECLKCNPERLELLHCPERAILETTNTWKSLVELREYFYERDRVYFALCGYSTQQLKKYRAKEGDLWKPAMHLLRLMYQGVHFFETGEYKPDMTDKRDYLLSIRRGEVKAEYIENEFEKLRTKFTELKETTKIPVKQDKRKLVEWLQEVRKANW